MCVGTRGLVKHSLDDFVTNVPMRWWSMLNVLVTQCSRRACKKHSRTSIHRSTAQVVQAHAANPIMVLSIPEERGISSGIRLMYVPYQDTTQDVRCFSQGGMNASATHLISRYKAVNRVCLYTGSYMKGLPVSIPYCIIIRSQKTSANCA